MISGRNRSISIPASSKFAASPTIWISAMAQGRAGCGPARAVRPQRSGPKSHSLPTLLRLTIDTISGAKRSSSVSRPARRLAWSPARYRPACRRASSGMAALWRAVARTGCDQGRSCAATATFGSREPVTVIKIVLSEIEGVMSDVCCERDACLAKSKLPHPGNPSSIRDIRRNGAPEGIRTPGLCLRRAALYPAELRVLIERGL